MSIGEQYRNLQRRFIKLRKWGKKEEINVRKALILRKRKDVEKCPLRDLDHLP